VLSRIQSAFRVNVRRWVLASPVGAASDIARPVLGPHSCLNSEIGFVPTEEPRE